MLTLTDGIVFVLLLYYGLTGWRKGFWRSLLGPFSLLVCVYAAMIYFQKTHNILVSFSISLVGPFVVNFLGSVIIRLVRMAGGQSDNPAGWGTRILGAAVNLVWGSVMIGLTIFLMALSPVVFSQMARAKADVVNSQPFAFLSRQLRAYFPRGLVQPQTLAVPATTSPGLEGPAVTRQPSSEAQASARDIPEAKALLEDTRVQDMISDPEVIQLIKEKNYMQLLNNPKFTKILEDPQLVMKFLEINRKMGEARVVENAVSETKEIPDHGQEEND